MYRYIPNLITVARLILTVVFFALLHLHDAGNFSRQMWIAFVIFVVAGLTDILDGYLARSWKVESAFGRIVDPFVDKIMICGAFIFFSSNAFIDTAARKLFDVGTTPADTAITGVAPWMVVVLIAREFLITGIRGLAESRGVAFPADWAGKVKMFTQAFAVGAVMVHLATTGAYDWIRITRDIAIWTTVVVTVLSMTTYIVRANKLFRV